MRLLAPIESLVEVLTDKLRRERAIIVVIVGYVAIWTIYGMLAKATQDVHFDAAQWVVVAREPALGYAPHPPFCAWLAGLWFSLFPVADWAHYLLDLTLAGFGLWFAWLLSGRFLDAEKRVLALAMLTLIPFFNFHAFKFDHDLVLIPLCAATTLCFLRAFETKHIGWAALAGAGAAAAMLTKYWAIFLLAGLAVAALLDQRRNSYFQSRAPWVTAGVGALLLVPHVAWLIANDFPPFRYVLSAHHSASLGAALMSAAAYLAGGAAYVALPVLLVLAASRPSGAALRDMLKPQTNERRFPAIAFWIAILAPVVVVLAARLELNAMWIMSSLTLLPVVVLSSPMISIPRPAVVGIVSFAVAFPMLMVVAAPVIAIVKLRGVEEEAGAYSKLLAERVQQEWRRTTDKPLRLVGGDHDLSYTTAFYLPDRPSPFPRFDPQIGRWVDAARIARQGIAMVCYHASGSTPRCRHHAIGDTMENIAASGPPGRRAVVELARHHLGMTGPPARFIIVTVPPQP